MSETVGVSGPLAQKLPAAAAQPQTESFEALYARTFARVYAYVASLLRDRAGAEDVTAQAFERAYRRRGSYRPSRGSAEAWLFGIARNAALDELRRRRRRSSLESGAGDVEDPSVDDQAETARRRELVRAAVATLDGPERDLVALKFAGGLSNAEIATALGISESNAGSKLHRVMTKLREACREAA